MKVDLYAENKAEYATPKKPVLLDVSPAQYLSIEGTGDPGGEEFQAAIGALYNVAYTIKMASKLAGRDYGVCKLEGLYTGIGPGNWRWRLMIRTPGFITAKELESAKAALKAKSKPSEVQQIKLEKLREGKCIQMLHVGPYDDEQRTIAQMTRFAEENGLKCNGAHHEIYLSDPRRVAPERLRTILRLPAQRV
jgi:hypothetical protein